MTQQINLFNPLFTKQRKYFSAATMLQALGLVVVAMAVFYGYEYAQQAALERQIADSDQAVQKQTRQLAAVKSTMPEAQSEASLDQQIKDAEALVAARQKLLQELHAGDAAKFGGFSGYLRAFARQTVDGVWLTAVHIAEAGADFTVVGRAVQADLVPQMLRRLNGESLLRGTQFESLGIKRVVPPPPAAATPEATVRTMPPYLEFTLASRFRNLDLGDNPGRADAPAPAAAATGDASGGVPPRLADAAAAAAAAIPASSAMPSGLTQAPAQPAPRAP